MNTSFAVGPSQLFDFVGKEMKNFADSGLGSISHRSEAFRALHKDAIQNLRQLMNIPQDFGIFFAGSASEIWERILLQLADEGSYHWCNGSFSNRFYEYAEALHTPCAKLQKEEGEGFSEHDIPDEIFANLICLTQNETSTGVQTDPSLFKKIKAQFPNKILAVDMVSSAPSYIPDFEVVDTAFFSVQKCFGLPAGLGVWIVSPKLLVLSQKVAAKRSIGAHHQLANHWKNFKKNETHSTPNVLGIYLLNKVCLHLINQNWNNSWQRQLVHRASCFYDIFENSKTLFAAVKAQKDRSHTTLVLEAASSDVIQKIKETLKNERMTISSGYGKAKDLQIRIANFPAISDTEFEKMKKTLDKFI